VLSIGVIRKFRPKLHQVRWKCLFFEKKMQKSLRTYGRLSL